MKITLPLIKPALMVAVLFRTLDAFRIYDAVFIITRGANDTETVSILGYEQLVNRLNLGLGSAVSILIFFCVILIAFVFIRFLGRQPGAGGRSVMDQYTPQPEDPVGDRRRRRALSTR